MEDNKIFAVKCSITGEGMNEGYCIKEGEMYIKYESDLLKHIRELEMEDNVEYDKLVAEGKLTDDFIFQDYYQSDYYYWIEWECEEDNQKN